MEKEPQLNQDDTSELEELGDDQEVKELGDEELGEIGKPKNPDGSDDLELDSEDEKSETGEEL